MDKSKRKKSRKGQMKQSGGKKRKRSKETTQIIVKGFKPFMVSLEPDILDPSNARTLYFKKHNAKSKPKAGQFEYPH